MGAISELVAVLALRDLIGAWDAAKEKRKSRQEEIFVPFNLSRLPQQKQSVCQPARAVVKATSTSQLPTML